MDKETTALYNKLLSIGYSVDGISLFTSEQINESINKLKAIEIEEDQQQGAYELRKVMIEHFSRLATGRREETK